VTFQPKVLGHWIDGIVVEESVRKTYFLLLINVKLVLEAYDLNYITQFDIKTNL
jgi:hypothetical protein